jgi:bacterioferritin
MDTSTFIERLNEDLGTEYQSILQYIQHIATIKAPEYHSITEEMDNHLVHELQDAGALTPRSGSARTSVEPRWVVRTIY